MANTVEYDCTQHDVDAVTVFQTNRAEIKRTIRLDLKDGQNEIEIKSLPSCLDEDSIRVDGIGNAVIFDVIYHAPTPHQPPQDDYIQSLYDEKNRLKAECSVFDNQLSILKTYSKTLSSKDTNTDGLENFLDVYASRQRSIDGSLTTLRKQLDEVNKSLVDASKVINVAQQNTIQRGVRVTIVVLAEGDGEATLSLTYVVSSAWWKPHYDLRASIAQDSKSDSYIHLHYRASVVQKTGEDWSSVALTLSTAAPLQGTNIPTLEPTWITKPVPDAAPSHNTGRRPVFRGRSRSRSPHRIVIASSRRSRSRSPQFCESPRYSPRLEPLVLPPDLYKSAQTNAFGQPNAPPPGFFRGQDSTATDGTVSTTFAIPGRSTIPSDSVSSSQTHNVSIAEIDFDSVDLEWVTVPKDMQSVFLRCKVQNTSKYALLPGQTNVFLNNSFVAKSNVPHVNPQESFSCSLGADPSVRVTYHPQSKKTKTASAFGIGSKTTTTTFQQSVTIKNTRLTSIGRLVMKDQVPVSRDAAIKVNILEPKDLNAKTAADLVVVKKCVKASWAQQNEESSDADRRNAKDLGFIDWFCEINPGETLDLDLAWEIVTSSGVDWVKQQL